MYGHQLVSPAIDYGSKFSQLFVGSKSLVSDLYGMKTYEQFLNTLEYNIRARVSMSALVSYSAQY